MDGHDARTRVMVKCSCGMSFDINEAPLPSEALRLAGVLWDAHKKIHTGETAKEDR